MGIPLIEGGFFNEYDREGSKPVVVIDENLARHAFGRKNVVGEHLWIRALGAAPVENNLPILGELSVDKYSGFKRPAL